VRRKRAARGPGQGSRHDIRSFARERLEQQAAAGILAVEAGSFAAGWATRRSRDGPRVPRLTPAQVVDEAVRAIDPAGTPLP
jgi:hypothetical protein